MNHTQFKIIKRSCVVLFVFYEHKRDGPLLATLYKKTRQIYLLTSAFYVLCHLTIFLWVNNILIFLLWNFFLFLTSGLTMTGSASNFSLKRLFYFAWRTTKSRTQICLWLRCRKRCIQNLYAETKIMVKSIYCILLRHIHKVSIKISKEDIEVYQNLLFIIYVKIW
jgi:hypothetical protein